MINFQLNIKLFSIMKISKIFLKFTILFKKKPINADCIDDIRDIDICNKQS